MEHYMLCYFPLYVFYIVYVVLEAGVLLISKYVENKEVSLMEGGHSQYGCKNPDEIPLRYTDRILLAAAALHGACCQQAAG